MRGRPTNRPAPDPLGGITLPQERWRMVVSRVLMVGVLGWLVAILEACVMIGK